MRNYQNDFESFDGKIWLNCASEGALPKVAAQAVYEAVEWKLKPYNLTLKRFGEVPKLLRERIGGLINVPAQDVILANSASYGIHLLANGLPLERGDEILLMQNDFPTDIIPWLYLEKKGVIVRQLKAAGPVIIPAELELAITAATKLVCLPHVHTFSGHVVDIRAIGNICRKRGIIFVVNFSQSAGNMPLDISVLPVDALTCAGFKWLLGPYGTGFCWMTPELRARLDYNQAFWGSALSAQQLESEGVIELREMNTARKYDVFGTANFFNFFPWAKSLEYLTNIGMEAVQAHNMGLVGDLVGGLRMLNYDLISPSEPLQRSNLVVFSHVEKMKNGEIFQRLLHQGIFLALWKGNFRAAPHIFNTPGDVHALLGALGELK